MGKLGGEELNYSSDIDLMFVYGAEGETAGGPRGPAGQRRVLRPRRAATSSAIIESVTEEGYVFRVDLRLRPEGRMGAVALSLDGYRAYHRERAELWERQALLKARVSAGDERVGARFMDFAREIVYRPGVDERVVPAIRAMKRGIDRELARRGAATGARNVKLGRGGIREIEFIVQALQLLYGGDDPWLRERNSLKALFRLTERGYLAPDLGRALSHALVHLRTVEHRLQLLHEFQTHTLPERPAALGRLARRARHRRLAGDAAARTLPRAATGRSRAAVHRAFVEFFARAPGAGPARGRGCPSLMALRATGFADPERARQNLRLILEGRPLVPYAGALRAALERLYPDAARRALEEPGPRRGAEPVRALPVGGGPARRLHRAARRQPRAARGAGPALRRRRSAHAAPDHAARAAGLAGRSRRAGAARRTRAAAGGAGPRCSRPRRAPAERRDRLRRIKQAEELTIVWRYLLGVTTIERYAREMTRAGRGHAGGRLAAGPGRRRSSATACRATRGGRFVPAVIVGVGKLGGRELTTGSDLDLFVVFDAPGPGEGTTDGAEPVDAHTFYSGAVERLAGALGDITPAGVAFAVDLRLRPGSKGSGFAASVDALERYYEDHGDLWERQTLTRARLVLGDRRPRPPGAGDAAATRVRRAAAASARSRRSGRCATRMEVELGKETPGRWHVKLGRGGLVDVEFLAQALQLVHGAEHPDVRRTSTHRRRWPAWPASARCRRPPRPRWPGTTASCAACRRRSACSAPARPTRWSSPAPCRPAWPARWACPRATRSWPPIASARRRCGPTTGYREVVCA